MYVIIFLMVIIYLGVLIDRFMKYIYYKLVFWWDVTEVEKLKLGFIMF